MGNIFGKQLFLEKKQTERLRKADTTVKTVFLVRFSLTNKADLMKRFSYFATNRKFRNTAFIVALASCLLGASTGCAIFDKKTDNDAKIAEFEEDAETDEKKDDADADVFDSERKEQSNMSDFVSSFGRKSKNKKEVAPGQTFLMSDKAKEIYANTER